MNLLMRRGHGWQVRVFSSKEHVRALNAEDAWVVVGFSDELIKLAKVVLPNLTQ
jgi:hypothetical protein